MGDKGDTFEVIIDESPQIFPIDFSIRELVDLWEEDHRGIRKKLIRHPLVKSALRDVIPARIPKEKNFPPPIETAPFFKSFYKVSKKPPFHTALQQSKIPPEVKEQFLYQLCQELVKEVSPKEDSSGFDLASFCRHVLFKNNSFGRIVMENFWETQLKVRMAKLQELSSSASFEVQTKILHNCLLALDYNILLILDEKKRRGDEEKGAEEEQKNQGGEEQPLDEFLKELLSQRRELMNDSGGYELPNIPISTISDEKTPIKDMKTAFSLLNSNRNRKYKDSTGQINLDSILWRARHSYLDYFADKIGESLFETWYFELQEYFQLTNSTENEEVLCRKLESRMKDECQPIIDYCCYKLKGKVLQTQLPGLPMEKYVELFRDVVSKKITDYHIWAFRNVYESVSMNSELRIRYNHLQQMKDSVSTEAWNFAANEMCRGITGHFQPFMLWLSGMWNFLYEGYICDPYSRTFISDHESDIETFTSGGKRAAEFFDRTELFTYSTSMIDAYLKSIKSLTLNPANLTLPEQWLDAVHPFLIGGVLQILEKIVKERTKELVPNFIALQEVWASMDDEISGNTNESS